MKTKIVLATAIIGVTALAGLFCVGKEGKENEQKIPLTQMSVLNINQYRPQISVIQIVTAPGSIERRVAPAMSVNFSPFLAHGLNSDRLV
ncbi:MAG: hypothetical protein WB586_14975 [Chthoniobacterales bacterium]